MRYFLPTGLLIIGLLPLSLQAQKLSAADSAEIQQKALRHVRQFEGLLNLVAQPDKYFRKYSFTKLIRSFYDEQSDYQIFRDSLVAIEDDLNPKAQPDDNNFLTIKDYLKAFFSFYEKSPIASVFFSEYEVSPVKQGEFTYVEVFYLSEFTNRHRAYPDRAYPLRYHKATLRAQRQEDGWQVVIANINYKLPGEELVASLAGGTATFTQPTYPPEQAASTSGLEKLDRGSDYQLRWYDTTFALREVEYLPFVEGPAAASNSGVAPQNETEVFRKFTPYIMKKYGQPSVQIVFKNPADDTMLVTLTDTRGNVLYSEPVSGRQSYAKSVSLRTLPRGVYRIKIAHADYQHSVRIHH